MSKYDEVLKPFVQLMEKELRANATKGDRPGWLSMSPDTCLLEIIYHFGKLQASVKRGDIESITEYAADVANMSMMLVDIFGALPDKDFPSADSDTVDVCAQHHRDSGELRKLCASRDSARRQRDHLKAENEALRSDSARLQRAEDFVRKLCDAAGNQKSVATGYLHDVLSVIATGEQP